MRPGAREREVWSENLGRTSSADCPRSRNSPRRHTMTIPQDGSNLIFLFSQPRAGSTLLQRILGRHPDIHTVAEPWIMLPSFYVMRPDRCEAEYTTQGAWI